MAGRRDKRKRQEARRQAHLDRVADRAGDGSATDARRQHARDASARAAAVAPSAARWLVAANQEDGTDGRPLDVVAALLALDPRTRLRGRGEDDLRALAAHVEALVGMDVRVPSGRSLLEVLVADAATRDALAPTLDLEALLGDGPVPDRSHDRAVRLAQAMLERAEQHRDGTVDLHDLVAPVGTQRHPAADELEAVARVATEQVPLPPSPTPAIVVTSGGWVGASPVELFLAACRGLLDGRVGAVGGAALYAWLDRAAHDPGDPWWLALSGLLEVDPPALLQPAAARAGSDHPDVAGSVLADLIALRHPLG